MLKRLSATAALVLTAALLSSPLHAQSTAAQVVPGYMTSDGCPGSQTACFNGAAAASGAINAATVGTSAAQVLAAHTAKSYLMLANPSAPGGNTVYCAFGATPTVAGAGTVPFSPGQSFTWEGSFIPDDAVSCIATGASTPFTVGAH